MEKFLKLYKLDADGIGQPFPNTERQAILYDFDYQASTMGSAPTITAKLMYPQCLDDLFNEDVYVTFKGERYYTLNTPSSSKKNTDARYEHSMSFLSERSMLEDVYFYDVVTEDADVDRYQSNTTDVNFYGDIKEFVYRLNKSMERSKVPYRVVIDEGITSDVKQVTFSDYFLNQALQEIFNIFNIPYRFEGYEIRVGFTDGQITNVFKYGQKNELLTISKNNTNNRIINRCTAIGSSNNIPYYYPNSTEKGDLSLILSAQIPQDGVTIMDPIKFGKMVSLTDVIENKIIKTDFQLLNYEASTFFYYNYEVKRYVTSKVGMGRINKVFIPKSRYNSETKEFVFESNLQLFVAPKEPNIKVIIKDQMIWRSSSEHLIYKGMKVEASITAGEIQIEEDFDEEGNFDGYKYTLPPLRANTVYSMTIKYTETYTTVTPLDFLDENLFIGYEFRPYSGNSYQYGWFIGDKNIEDFNDYGLSVTYSPEVGDTIKQSATVIPYAPNLMPPIYRETSGEEKFYNATNDTYPIPDKEPTEYYFFENEYKDNKRKEGKGTFDDIQPTIVGITNADGQRIDMIADIAFDEKDNNETDEDDNNNLKHPYFFVKLKKFNGDWGFNLFEHAIQDNTPMTISFTSGNNAACMFEIGVEKATMKNIVQVNDDGTLKRDKDGNVMFGAAQDRQNDTINNEVWLALKKDINTYPDTFPNKAVGFVPTTEDTFVILYIELPKAYVLAAENRLKEALVKYMWENNYEKFNFSIDFSRIYLAKNPDVAAKLNENSTLNIEYNGQVHTLYVSSYSYKVQADEPLPEVKVELSDTITIAKSGLQRITSEIQADFANKISNIDFVTLASNKFLRKDIDDTANNKITFNKRTTYNEVLKVLKAIEMGTFNQGASGGMLRVDELGNSYLDVSYLNVYKKATFTELVIAELKHVGGQIILSPAAMTISSVVEYDEFYRCYFLEEDSDGRKITNQFEEGDQVRCQTFNIGDNANRYYWRLVVGIGENYIDLSISDADINSDIPQAGDNIALFGNRDDATRQNAIMLSAYGTNAPCIIQYKGINSYANLDEKIVTKFATDGNKIVGDFQTVSGTNLGDALSDHETRIKQTEESISLQAQSITEIQGDVSDNKKAIQQNTTNISLNSKAISAQATEISELDNRVSQAEIKVEPDNINLTVSEQINNKLLGNLILGTAENVRGSGNNTLNQIINLPYIIQNEAAQGKSIITTFIILFRGCSFNSNSSVWLQSDEKWNYSYFGGLKAPLSNKGYIVTQKQVLSSKSGDAGLMLRLDYINGGTITITGLRCYLGETDYGWKEAEADTIVSSINISPKEIKIKSQKIALEGCTTINGTFAIDEDGFVTSKGIFKKTPTYITPENYKEYCYYDDFWNDYIMNILLVGSLVFVEGDYGASGLSFLIKMPSLHSGTIYGGKTKNDVRQYIGNTITIYNKSSNIFGITGACVSFDGYIKGSMSMSSITVNPNKFVSLTCFSRDNPSTGNEIVAWYYNIGAFTEE